jgi:hypothetical protein
LERSSSLTDYSGAKSVQKKLSQAAENVDFSTGSHQAQSAQSELEAGIVPEN